MADPEIDIQEQVKHLDYVWWYKTDGTRTASKLPQDAYHTQRFTERGWTRKPPVSKE